MLVGAYRIIEELYHDYLLDPRISFTVYTQTHTQEERYTIDEISFDNRSPDMWSLQSNLNPNALTDNNCLFMFYQRFTVSSHPNASHLICLRSTLKIWRQSLPIYK